MLAIKGRFHGGEAFLAAVPLAVIALIASSGWWLHLQPGRGAPASFSLLVGAALGVILQRGRFCFFCIFRELIEDKNSRGFYSVLAALAVGSVCYSVLMGMFLPNPFTGGLPPDAHVGPVSWALIAAGIAFGLGMALSGACISGHLYRLGEGYGRAPFALIGSVVGFALGFLSWRPLYTMTISTAPLPWLPRHLGYSGALALQLAVLGALAFALVSYLPAKRTVPGGPVTPRDVWNAVLVREWSPGVTGSALGVLGAFAYLRVAPLGVTSQLGSLARTVMTDAGVLADRLNGLDGFSGCITAVVHAVSNNGFLISGLTAASFAAAVVSRRFRPSGITMGNAVTALLGGVLMGWGSMIALGCTVGTLLSGIMAMSLSGWVFFAAVFTGVWAGIRMGWHRLAP